MYFARVGIRLLNINNMNIALTISCFFIFGFIHEGNCCCCTLFCTKPITACNIFGCNCNIEKCWNSGGGWPHLPNLCPQNEKCDNKKFRNRIEVN